jgi:hypothetical protein
MGKGSAMIRYVLECLITGILLALAIIFVASFGLGLWGVIAAVGIFGLYVLYVWATS